MKISLFSLVVLMIAGIDNLKNMPSVALLGSSMIFFFGFAAILFLIPTALVSAELSSTFPTKGGIYQWVKRAFGDKWALAAVWFQWINTMIWYPTMLSFIAATLAYVIDPDWAQNKFYLVGTTLAIFWGLTWINLKGIQASSKIVNYCALFGTLIPIGGLIVIGLFWLFQGQELQVQFTSKEMLPSLSTSEGWVSLIAIMASFLGMELCGVHVNDIQNPKKNFPKAAMIAVVFILLSMGLSSLAIAMIIPKDQINLLSGVMQVFQHLLNVAHLSKLAPLAAFLIAIGAIGTMVNWLIAPAKGLLQAAEDGYLPASLSKTNRHGVASKILIGQGILVSLISLIFLLPKSPSESFWLLTALSTELYMIMYLLMFAALLKLRYEKGAIDLNPAFKLSTKNLWVLCGCGTVGCVTTILFSFLPPEETLVDSPIHYALQVLGCNLMALLPLAFFYRYKTNLLKIQSKASCQAAQTKASIRSITSP